MLKPINETIEIWNKRLRGKIKSTYQSQRDFSSAYKDRFDEGGNQSDISNWSNVGNYDAKRNANRGFPSFETMHNIASVLGVDIGYLIGETDYESFELEYVCKYLGLSQKAVMAIIDITSGKLKPPFRRYSCRQYTVALELLLTNGFFLEFIEGLCNLALTINEEQTPPNYFEYALNCIPESYRDNALAARKCEISSAEEADALKERGIEYTPELRAFVDILELALVVDHEHPSITEQDIAAARYSLQEIYVKMVAEMMSQDHVSMFIPQRMD